MLKFSDRLIAITQLGKWIKDFCTRSIFENEAEISLNTSIQKQYIYNQWHTEAFIHKELSLWTGKLSHYSLTLLTKHYSGLEANRSTCQIAVIPGDDLPLDGFSDFIFTILAGHHFYCRNSNHEHDLLQLLTKQLISIEPKLADNIHWVDKFPKAANNFLVYDKSENISRLSQYLGPNKIIRGRKISVAIISPNDSRDQFKLLADDIFNFFGRSNYNVRKIYIPENFPFNDFFESIEHHSYVVRHNKYANHYDYQRNVLLMDRKPFLDNGFILVKESQVMEPPISCLYYEYYQDLTELNPKLKTHGELIQQIVTNFDIVNSVKPGGAFGFSFTNFDEHKETLQFLMNLQ